MNPNGIVFTVSRRVRFNTPSEWRARELAACRYELGRKLFDVLWTNRLPCVVDVEENIYKTPSEFYPTTYPDEVIEYKVSLTPVKFKNVTIERFYPEMGKYKNKGGVLSWIKRIFRK